MQWGIAAAEQVLICWQSLTMPQRELRGFPTQMASPQPQVLSAGVRASARGERRGVGAESIGVSIAEQEVGSAGVLGPASSAAWLGAASEAAHGRSVSAAAISFQGFIISPLFLYMFTCRRGGVARHRSTLKSGAPESSEDDPPRGAAQRIVLDPGHPARRSRGAGAS